MKTPLQVGQKLTFITVNSMAMTVYERIQVATLLAEPQFLRGKLRFGTFKARGKRKEFYLDIEEHATLVFDGWAVPFISDADATRPNGNSFWMNACMNLAGDAQVIKDWVENRNLNEKFCDSSKAKILIFPPDGMPKPENFEGTILYPDLEAGSAVIDRMKERGVRAN
jgi:hypothetical protein